MFLFVIHTHSPPACRHMFVTSVLPLPIPFTRKLEVLLGNNYTLLPLALEFIVHSTFMYTSVQIIP